MIAPLLMICFNLNSIRKKTLNKEINFLTEYQDYDNNSKIVLKAILINENNQIKTIIKLIYLALGTSYSLNIWKFITDFKEENFLITTVFYVGISIIIFLFMHIKFENNLRLDIIKAYEESLKEKNKSKTSYN